MGLQKVTDNLTETQPGLDEEFCHINSWLTDKVFTFCFCSRISQGVVLQVKLYFQKNPQPNVKKPNPPKKPNHQRNLMTTVSQFVLWLLGFIWCHKLKTVSYVGRLLAGFLVGCSVTMSWKDSPVHHILSYV